MARPNGALGLCYKVRFRLFGGVFVDNGANGLFGTKNQERGSCLSV